MNQPCESGGVLLPNSAVPVLPYTSPRSASAFAVPESTTSPHHRPERVEHLLAGPLRRRPRGLGADDLDRRGRVPLAMPAATSASWAGLISTSPWPIASAAFVVPVLVAGHGAAEDVDRQLPVGADAVGGGRRRRGRRRAGCSACWMKVVLQDWANATRSGTVPRSNWSSFSNSRPSTTVVPGHATGVSGVTAPAESSAVAVIVFMLDPGGKWPVSALPASAAAFEETARISPVPGRTTTRWVGSVLPGDGGVGRVLHGRDDRRLHRPAGHGGDGGDLVPLVGGVLVGARDRDREAGRAGELLLEGPLQAGEAQLVAGGVPRRSPSSRLLDDLGRRRADAAQQREREAGATVPAAGSTVGKTAPGRSKTCARIFSKSGRRRVMTGTNWPALAPSARRRRSRRPRRP